MNTKQLVAFALVLASSAALAQESLATVEVRAESEMSLNISCSSHPAKPSIKEVERVLGITDPSQSSGLRKKLMSAAAEACEAGMPKIQVTRGSDGRSLTWKAME